MLDNKITKLLQVHGIEYTQIEHPAVFTMEEMEQLNLPNFHLVAKNLFLRDDKKRNYYLLVVNENRKINIKQVRRNLQTRPLSFASKEDLETILNSSPGSVTPFGVLDDKDKKVIVYIDSYFQDQLIGIHPNTNQATIWLQVGSLKELIKEHGNIVEVIDFDSWEQ